MQCFKWERVQSEHLGVVKIPIAEIAIKNSDNNWKYVKVIVDSGAVVSLFKYSFGEFLGLDVKKGKLIELGGIGKGKLKAYLHKLKLKIGDFEIYADVAFAENDLPPNLLGRISIFDDFEIRFKNVEMQTCFIKTLK